MPNTLDFPKFAATCLRLARDTNDADRQKELIELTQTWLALYEEDAKEVDLILRSGKCVLRPCSRLFRQTLH